MAVSNLVHARVVFNLDSISPSNSSTKWTVTELQYLFTEMAGFHFKRLNMMENPLHYTIVSKTLIKK